MKKEKDITATGNEADFNRANKGIFVRVLIFTAIVIVAAVTISVLSDINVGRTPEIFGFALNFLG